MEDDRRDKLMEAIRAAAKTAEQKPADAAADAAGQDAEAKYANTVEDLRATTFVRELNDELQTLGPKLPEIAGRAVGGLPTEPSHTANPFHGDHHDEVMEYRVSQMTIIAKACRGEIRVEVNRVADGSQVLARDLGPADLRGDAYQETMAGLMHDFVVKALAL
jgi:hypothetical protein